jgi:hypothetical protein
MSKRRRRFRGCSERWVGLPHWLLNSAAFRSLPGDAVKLLLAVWRRHNGVNNGEISYSCREAAEIGLSLNKAGRMFGVLVDRGFLVVVRGAGFNNKQLSRTWRLTAEKRGSEKATKEFMRWQPETTNGTHPKFFSSATHSTDSATGSTLPPKLPQTVLPVGLYGRKRPPQ